MYICVQIAVEASFAIANLTAFIDLSNVITCLISKTKTFSFLLLAFKQPTRMDLNFCKIVIISINKFESLQKKQFQYIENIQCQFIPLEYICEIL